MQNHATIGVPRLSIDRATDQRSPTGQADATAALRGERPAWSFRRKSFLPFKVYRRDRLARGMAFAGPCLVEEDEAPTVIDVDSTVTIDRFGSLDINFPTAE